MATRTALLSLISLLPVACTIPSSLLAPPQGGARQGENVTIDVFYEDVEFGEIEVDGGLTGGGGTATDVFIDDAASRERIGVHASGGIKAIRGYVRVFTETFTLNDTMPTGLDTGGAGLVFPTDFDMFGVSFGLEGDPGLVDLGSDTELILRYRLGASASQGDDGLTDLAYAEIEGEVGIGFDWMGLRPVVGAQFSALKGEIENQNDPEIEGMVNAGGFVDLRYRPDNTPFFASVRGSFGDLEGVQVMAGFVF